MTDLQRTGPEPATGRPVGGFVIRPAVIWGVVVALVAVFAVSSWAREQVVTSLVRGHEAYTGLAFTDPADPLDCATGTSSIQILNHDGKDRTYRWTATTRTTEQAQGHPAGRTSTRRGTLAVRDGASGITTVALGGRPTASFVVSIALDGGRERIQAACTGRAS